MTTILMALALTGTNIGACEARGAGWDITSRCTASIPLEEGAALSWTLPCRPERITVHWSAPGCTVELADVSLWQVEMASETTADVLCGYPEPSSPLEVTQDNCSSWLTSRHEPVEDGTLLGVSVIWLGECPLDHDGNRTSLYVSGIEAPCAVDCSSRCRR